MPNWAHAPVHRTSGKGAYIVTGATYRKTAYLNSPEKLTSVEQILQELASVYRLTLQAWAILSNHYHFVALSKGDPPRLSTFISHFHTKSATILNRLDEQPGRKVWYQFWDTLITDEKSYFSRLHYVHENPVHHGVCNNATLYPWCSAGWFEREAAPAFRKTVMGFKLANVKVPDDF